MRVFAVKAYLNLLTTSYILTFILLNSENLAILRHKLQALILPNFFWHYIIIAHLILFLNFPPFHLLKRLQKEDILFHLLPPFLSIL